MKEIIIFCVALAVPFIFFRTLIYFISKPISQLHIYTREGLKFHHFHYGLMLLFVGILALLLLERSPFSLILTGLGLGTVLDEFIPSLYLPEPEPAVTKIYKGSFGKTAAVVAGVISAILLISVIVRQ